VRLTRKQLVVGGAGAALGAAGLYELVDQMTSAPARPAPAASLPPEQHILDGVRVVTDNDVEVLVPPLHHQVVTLELDVSPGDLADARTALEAALADLEASFPATPAGLGITVAWGLPYLRRFVPKQAEQHVPVDLRASHAAGREVRVIEAAERFQSDPDATILEANDAVILLRSDSLDAIRQGSDALVGKLGFWKPNSIRRGFAGGGFDGGTSLPKRMAMAAGVGGASLIPDRAELFLGFTSTQKASLGPARIANIETLGYADQRAGGYFKQGTTMHLSHITEDLEGWYLIFDHGQRVSSIFKPEQKAAPDVLTVPQGREHVATIETNTADFAKHRSIGHSASLQTASRLAADVAGPDGARYPKGTAVPQRADFNTLDNPFSWSSRPETDAMVDQPAAGLHFVVFHPTTDDFRRVRRAMDGQMPDGTRIPLRPKDRGQGINSVLTTTHRQNFLVPPRRSRAFPLSELEP
jgi:hypothetical protein